MKFVIFENSYAHSAQCYLSLVFLLKMPFFIEIVYLTKFQLHLNSLRYKDCKINAHSQHQNYQYQTLEDT